MIKTAIIVVFIFFAAAGSADEVKVDRFKVMSGLLEIEIRQAIHTAAQIGYIYGTKRMEYGELCERITELYGENPGLVPDIYKKYAGLYQD